ncbi:hypothetical protein ACFSKN_16410 [Mariniflexile gromovii]|uniref:HTH cro/C1-type domain-containing protein n=1 Tax=Mariniflexile gromovii TaxID=362523 RepID=A0ABS4BYM2_9FLAO|nr:hypothetical protein [Mariniflexile gromovii]MBP0905684.1 hypothetical protein [Mariniflexile gromovii]
MEFSIENKKLKELIEKKALGNNSAFAKEIGVSPTHINRFFRLDPRSDCYPSILKSTAVLKAVMKRFPEITVEWFKVLEEKSNYVEEHSGVLIEERLLKHLEARIKDAQRIIELLEAENLRLKEGNDNFRKNDTDIKVDLNG